MFRCRTLAALIATAFALPLAHADIQLIAQGSISGLAHDLSGLSAPLENGVAGDLLGGMGSGLAWAGGDTFLALPDRGPNAVPWNSQVDDTASYVARFQTMQLGLIASSGGALPFTMTPTLSNTTLLYSSTALNYGPITPVINSAGKFYFDGRSDNFGNGVSTNPDNARLDPEAIRVSNDGKSVFVSDEYGPYIYQFDRRTGQRIKTFTLPDNLAVTRLSSMGTNEIANNTSGRVANKGMEGLTLTPDGKTLVGFMQSPLLQDGGDKHRYNRIVTVDVASGTTHEYAYDNLIGGKSYNSSEIMALNDHQFLVLERDGNGLNDGSSAKIKQLRLIDLSGAHDVTTVSGEANLAPYAVAGSLFLDIKSALNAAGISSDKIPAKLEGLAFGKDVTINGVLTHTLYVANDNDFIGTTAEGYDNPNQWYVFGVTDADLASMGASYVPQSLLPVPEPETYALMLAGLAAIAWMRRRREG
jgi:hypothetical protein